jgi:hypothetical protein
VKLLVVLLGLFSMSCAGHIEVVPRGCFSDDKNFTYALDFDPDFKPDFIIKKRIWTHGLTTEYSSPHQVFLKSYLGQHDVACKNIKSLRVTIDQSSKDVLFSVLPFISRHTLTVEGMYTN